MAKVAVTPLTWQPSITGPVTVLRANCYCRPETNDRGQSCRITLLRRTPTGHMEALMGARNVTVHLVRGPEVLRGANCHAAQTSWLPRRWIMHSPQMHPA